MADVSVLNVRLHGTKIGTITHIPGDRTFFAFTDEYVADQSRPTLSLSVSTSTRGGGFKKSVGRSKRHVQRITRPPKGGQPGYIPIRASSFWSSFS